MKIDKYDDNTLVQMKDFVFEHGPALILTSFLISFLGGTKHLYEHVGKDE
jgi:hypothetical protein